MLRYAHHIARYGAPDSTTDLAILAGSEKRAPSERLEILKAIQQGAQERGAALDEAARRVAAQLASQLLASSDPGKITLGIDVVRDFGFNDMQSALNKVIQRHDISEQPRMHAMGALTVINPAANVGTIADVLADPSAPISMRESAANLLGNIDRPEAKSAC